MASLLKVDALTGVTTAGSISVTGEGNSTTTNLQQGLAKVWSNQTTGTPNDSFNSSGITDNGTGDFTVNFSNAMSNANYSSTLGGADANTNAAVIVCVNNGAGYATGSINYFVVNEDTGATDYGPMSCTVSGDLA
tara:strand:+ start:404 stop:808 length:405 start_codon:yes stop_codon:yes gene_type:complete